MSAPDFQLISSGAAARGARKVSAHRYVREVSKRGLTGRVVAELADNWLRVRWDDNGRTSLVRSSEVQDMTKNGKRNPTRATWQRKVDVLDMAIYFSRDKIANAKTAKEKADWTAIIAQYEKRIAIARRHLGAAKNPAKRGAVKNPSGLTAEDYNAALNYITRMPGEEPDNVYTSATGIGKKRRAYNRALARALADARRKGQKAGLSRARIDSDIAEATGGRNPAKRSAASKDPTSKRARNSVAREHIPYSEAVKMLKFAKKQIKAFRQLNGHNPTVAEIANDIRGAYSVGSDAAAHYAHLAIREAESSKRNGKRNPNGVDALSSEFQGAVSGASKRLIAANGTPGNLARLGALHSLELVDGTAVEFNPRQAYLAADTQKNLHIVGSSNIRFDKRAPSADTVIDYGEIARVNYETVKKHLDNTRVVYYHDFGEDNGKRPSLHVDFEGLPRIVGGDYSITSAGIEN